MMEKILITGGAGFIGYHLAKKLIESNYEVDILDNFSRGIEDVALNNLVNSKKINLINLDLEETEKIKKLSKNYSYIYHLAAIVGVQHVISSPYKVLEKNHVLLSNVINFAKTQEKLKRFIFTSTSEVYAGTLKDYGLTFPTSEETILSLGNNYEKRNTYMLSKIYGEAMCTHSGLPFTIIRPHNFYGPRMGLSHVIPELLKKVYFTNETKLEINSANHLRTFCYIDDAVNMIIKLINNEGSINEVYNIGNSENEVSIMDVAIKIVNSIDKKIKLIPMPDISHGPKRRCPCTKKLKTLIEYKDEVLIDDGINRCYEWYLNNIFKSNNASAI